MPTRWKDGREDWLEGPGAHVLAETVRDYWHDRGHAVEVRVVELKVNGRLNYCVRSNLTNGLPPCET
jgi:hypothetical protein